jgi:hypothetical protein
MARIIIWGLNETLLDPSAPDPYFEQVFGAAATREVWFKQVIESAPVAKRFRGICRTTTQWFRRNY